MKTYLSLAILFLFTTGLFAPAYALFLAGSGTDRNTTAPADDPGWNNVGSVRSPKNDSRAGVVYLCDDWFITTYHAWWYDHPTGVVVGVTGYTVDTNSMVRLTNSLAWATNLNPNADIAMFRVTQKPNLPPLNITTISPGGLRWPVNFGPAFGGDKTIIMIGSGHPREDAPAYWDAGWTNTTASNAVYSGYKFWPDRSQCVLRWGSNQIETVSGGAVSFKLSLQPVFGDIMAFKTTFNTNAGPDECQIALLDSGGGVFYKYKGYWELTGLMNSMAEPDGTVPANMTGIANGGISSIVDLSYYRNQVMNIIKPNGWPDLVIVDSSPVTNSASPGTSVSIQITTRNRGTVAATNFNTTLYLVPSWNAPYTNAAQAAFMTLGAGESVTNTYTFRAPTDSGTYYLIAKADDNEQVHESYENNNQSGTRVRIMEVGVGFNYTINSDDTINITGYTGSGEAIDIPETINGRPVTSIGTNAFFNCGSLTAITVPESVTNIGDAAFYSCENLTGVYFHGDAPAIGSAAFGNATNATVYRLLEAKDWPTVPSLWGDRPTALWFVMANDWVVYEGKRQSLFISTEVPGAPAIKMKAESVLTAVYTKKVKRNGVLVKWSVTGGTNSTVDASLAVSAGIRRNDKIGRSIFEQDVISLSLNVGDSVDFVLFGTSTWSGKYNTTNAADGVSSEKLYVSLAGRSIDRAAADEGYGTETWRYNQTISDAMSATNTAGAETILNAYIATQTRVPGVVVTLPAP